MRYYSQNNEEQLILDQFGLVNNNFVVLDIGANDGKTFSNSRRVIEMGWEGHLIEPSPRAFDKLQTLYQHSSNVHLYNIGLLHKDTKAYLFESDTHDNGDDVALVSSYSTTEIEKWKKKNVKYEKVETTILSFQSFIDITHCQKFDLISLDIEGYEYVVLQQINLAQYDVKMLIIEWNGNQEIRNKIDAYCKKFNMVLVAENAENLIYKR